MYSNTLALITLLLVTQITTITCKAITHGRHGHHSRYQENEESLRRTALDVLDNSLSDRDDLSYRNIQSRQAAGGSEINHTEGDNAVDQACLAAIAGIEDFDSESGLGGCYSILSLNRTSGIYQAELRMYKIAAPSGAFAGLTADKMLVNLKPSSFTSNTPLTMVANSTGAVLGANYTKTLEGYWEGQIEPLDYSKLSESDFMALLFPDFELEALQPNTQVPVSVHLNTSSTVYYVKGDLEAPSQQQAITAAKPASALAAVAKASIFVLPGTTLGIFPIGLIVTASWALLFILTFGLGTIGRMRYRSLYRSRLVALGRLRSL